MIISLQKFLSSEVVLKSGHAFPKPQVRRRRKVKLIIQASSLNLSRDEPPPMITGTHKDGTYLFSSFFSFTNINNQKGSQVDEPVELDENELRELIQKEAKQFFSGLLQTKQGRYKDFFIFDINSY